MDSKLKKIIGNGGFLLLCIGLSIYFVLRGEDFDALVAYIHNSSQVYWLAGLTLMIAFILCESAIIFYLLRNLGEKPKITHCFLYSFVGFFFSLVTPTGSGGQPMQLVFMKKDGLSLGRCVPVLLMVTITYKAVLVLIGLIIAVFRPASIIPLLAPAMGWIWLGIILNVTCVGGMLALVFVPSIASRIIFAVMKFSSRFIDEERINRLSSKIELSMLKYEEASDCIKQHKLVTLNAFLITVFQRCLLFAVTYIVLLSFGIDTLSLLQTILLQGSISLSADMLPLPGGLGISEYLYSVIFAPACGNALVTPTLMVSRGLAFYSQLLASAIMSVFAYFAIFSRKGK